MVVKNYKTKTSGACRKARAPSWFYVPIWSGQNYTTSGLVIEVV